MVLICFDTFPSLSQTSFNSARCTSQQRKIPPLSPVQSLFMDSCCMAWSRRSPWPRKSFTGRYKPATTCNHYNRCMCSIELLLLLFIIISIIIIVYYYCLLLVLLLLIISIIIVIYYYIYVWLCVIIYDYVWLSNIITMKKKNTTTGSWNFDVSDFLTLGCPRWRHPHLPQRRSGAQNAGGAQMSMGTETIAVTSYHHPFLGNGWKWLVSPPYRTT